MTNQITNTDNQSNILEDQKQLEDENQLEDEKQSVIEISEPIGDSGSSIKLCHVSDDGNGITFTVSPISMSRISHLNHGDTLGECAE